jgi:hypothetical protein
MIVFSKNGIQKNVLDAWKKISLLILILFKISKIYKYNKN